MNLEQKIKLYARQTGFDAVGITSAEPFIKETEILTQRIQSGLLTGYGFTLDSIPRWTTPDHAVPGAQSIISVALSYDYRNPENSSRRLSGRIARFAHGLDYHEILHEKLLRLQEFIAQETNGEGHFKICVDTGPLLDRPAAVRSGIGWRGHNGCIYIPKYGSWVVLGELVTDLKLEPDLPRQSDPCAGCDRCLRACPTGALIAPYTINITRCISHLTQMKGSIPEDLRSLMGIQVYGCDVCQRVCPQNQNALPGNHTDFDPTLGLGPNPDLEMLLNLSAEEFRTKVGPTAIGWIRRSRFRRNAAVALGNSKDLSAIPILEKHREDSDLLVREHVLWALRQL